MATYAKQRRDGEANAITALKALLPARHIDDVMTESPSIKPLPTTIAMRGGIGYIKDLQKDLDDCLAKHKGTTRKSTSSARAPGAAANGSPTTYGSLDIPTPTRPRSNTQNPQAITTAIPDPRVYEFPEMFELRQRTTRLRQVAEGRVQHADGLHQPPRLTDAMGRLLRPVNLLLEAMVDAVDQGNMTPEEMDEWARDQRDHLGRRFYIEASSDEGDEEDEEGKGREEQLDN